MIGRLRERFLVTRDGQTRLRPMKGLELSKRQLGYIGIVGVVLVFLPQIAGAIPQVSFRTLHKGIIFGIAALGLNVILRHLRLVSFGHAAFFGTGAYAVAVLTAHYQIDAAVAMVLVAVLAATIMALVIGYLVRKTRAIYFALLTLAFNGVLYALVLGSSFFNFDDGLAIRIGGARPRILGQELSLGMYELAVYYLTLIALVLCVLGMYRLARSPFGRAMDAIGQNRTRARFLGVPVERTILIGFTISGLYGGVAGGLFALFELHVRPGPTLFVFVSGEILFMAILGGFQTLLGPLVGGIILIYLLDLARFYTEFHNALAGIVLLAFIYFFPAGLLGSVDRLKAGVRDFRDDPAVAGDWLTATGGYVRRRLIQIGDDVQVLLFGVK